MSDSSLASRIRSAGRPRDAAALVGVPAVLVGVFLGVPRATREALAFRYDDPTLATAFASHYVHLDAGHLAGNAVAYLLLATVGYALAVASDRRRFFVASLATYLLAFPFVLSALNLAVPRPGVAYGFSGIAMALLGLLPNALGLFLRETCFPELRLRDLPLLFFLSIAPIAVLAAPARPANLGVAAAALAIAVGYAGSVVGRVGRPHPETLRRVVAARGDGELTAVAVALFVVTPLAAFGTPAADGGTVPNLYVHLLGYCLAFIVAFLTLIVLERAPASRGRT